VKDIYASLDLGSSTIKLVVGELINSNINVLFAKMIPSKGITKGQITDEAAVSTTILQLVKEAEEELEAKITSVLLNIPTYHTRLYQNQGSCLVNAGDQRISEQHIVKALSQATRFEKSEKEAVVSVIPVNYYYGAVSSKEPPLGKMATSLYLDALIITTSKKLLYAYVRCVERAGLSVIDICVNAYSCAKEAFDEVYLREGAILIDIGYKTTSISFFEDGYLKFLTNVPMGGQYLSKKVSNAWEIPMTKAETYKIKYGTCNTLLSDEDVIHVTYKGQEVLPHTQKDLAILLSQGVEELMQAVKEQIMVINNGQRYEVVIVGGGGELENIEDVSSRVLECPVRTYRPSTIGARQMAFTANLGLIYYLSDRMKLTGKQTPSLVLPDTSHTMATRFKGLTKTNSLNKHSEKKISKVLDVLFSEEE